MRYPPEHKTAVHEKIVKDASRRVRSEGLNGAAVSSVMRDTGLTHGGFYKHFGSKEELLAESVAEAFRETADRLVRVGQEAAAGSEWKEMVRAYLSAEHVEHPERGCPLTALAPEMARADEGMKGRVLEGMRKYKARLVPWMPGRNGKEKEEAFFSIFSTMIGAVAIARMMPKGAMRKKVLEAARDSLLNGY